jgi:AraC-like DNA-binding protein
VAASNPQPYPPALPPPPRSAQRFRSDDLDEVGEFVARFAGSHSRVARGTGPLDFEQAWLTGASAMAGWIRTGLATTVRGAVRQPTLHVVLSGGAEYRFGRRRHATGPWTMMFVPPGWEYTTERLPGATFGLAFSHARLVEEIGACDLAGRGAPVMRARQFVPGRLTQSGLMAAITAYLQAGEHPSGPARLAETEAQLLGALANLLRDEAAAARGTEVGASRIADLEAWIEANLDAPISIGRLCAVAGVGERALQKSFESRRGMSPMRFVMERRLAQAHRQLLKAHPRDDVTHVAVRLGFNHTGRFAALYRQAFGESPSQSLRRARR